jgi:hypothetical protein
MLPILIVGVALFILAFVGLNKLLPTILGLASVIGLLFGIYFIWLGISGNNENLFGWGCVFAVGSGGILIYLKTAFGD